MPSRVRVLASLNSGELEAGTRLATGKMSILRYSDEREIIGLVKIGLFILSLALGIIMNHHEFNKTAKFFLQQISSHPAKKESLSFQFACL